MQRTRLVLMAIGDREVRVKNNLIMPGFVKDVNLLNEDVNNKDVRGSFGVFTHPIDPTETHAYMVKNRKGEGLAYFPTKLMATSWIRARKNLSDLYLTVERVDLEDGKFWLKITKTRMPRAKGERRNSKPRYEYKSEIIDDFEELGGSTYNNNNTKYALNLDTPNQSSKQNDRPTSYGDFTKTDLVEQFEAEPSRVIPNAFINLTNEELDKVNPSILKTGGDPLLPNLFYSQQFQDTKDRLTAYYKDGSSEVKIFSAFGDGEDEDKLEQSLIEGELLGQDFFENDGKAFFRDSDGEYTEQYVSFLHPKLARMKSEKQAHPSGWVYFDGKKETPLGNVNVMELKQLFDDTYIFPQTVEDHITIAPSIDDNNQRKDNNWLQKVNEKTPNLRMGKWDLMKGPLNGKQRLITKDEWISNTPKLLGKFVVDDNPSVIKPIRPQLYAWPIPRTIGDARTLSKGVKIYGFLQQKRSRKVKSAKGDSTYTNHGTSIVWNSKEDAKKIARYNRLNGVPTRVIPIKVKGENKFINLAREDSNKNTYLRRKSR